jgi:hypothetical protein
MCHIEDLASYIPASVGEGAESAAKMSSAEEKWLNYCKVLNKKTLFIGLHSTYSATLNELKAVLKSNILAGQANQDDGFKEVCTWKRCINEEVACASKKVALPATLVEVTTMSLKNGISWDVTPCGSHKNRRFGGT